MQPPSCAASLPSGTGRIAMPRHYQYQAHPQVQVIRHYCNRGMPGRRGWRQAFAPKSGNVNFVSDFSTFWGILPNHLFFKSLFSGNLHDPIRFTQTRKTGKFCFGNRDKRMVAQCPLCTSYARAKSSSVISRSSRMIFRRRPFGISSPLWTGTVVYLPSSDFILT